MSGSDHPSVTENDADRQTESGGPIERIRSVSSRTRIGIALALKRTDGKVMFLTGSLGYLLIYLWLIQDLGPGSGSFGITLVSDPISRALQSTGSLSWEAVALIDAGPVVYLFSPLNFLLAAILASLVGLNVALTLVVWRQPAACGLDSSASVGVLAGLPALLSGAACCGPILLLILGIQASGVLLLAFDFLVPGAIFLLILGLLLIGRNIHPELVVRNVE